MNFEQLGTFYLGREVEPGSLKATEQPLLYDASDLTTHAVIIGMTGSGKTGLGIDMIEEAAIDGVPVLAIDPKGDLGNLALAFPELRPADFEPWVNAREAERAGKDVAAYAVEQAQLWRDGLASWGQGPERVQRFKDAASVCIYTPGSSAGRPISVLRSFAAPGAAVLADPDLLNDRLDATATGLLTLLGLDADPLGREHILLATILDHAWRSGADMSVAALIHAVQEPPVRTIGVMDLDTVFPAKERLKLALALNTLLAAPSFEAWTKGDALDVQELLYTPAGKPRVAVISISHLSDTERMFFVTLLLSEVVAWTRSQKGTTSLRALVYIDELFGYLPPVAEPPSKKPLLTLLKQARAFGVGLVLSTQNPVDLDYKALSNAGSWFIGRLQTERDKSRLAEGLRAAAPGAVSVESLSEVIGRLAKRTFLLHNVHDAKPVLFQTRWAMSYLAGPLSREQIRELSAAGVGDVAGAAARTEGSVPPSAGTSGRPAGFGGEAAAGVAAAGEATTPGNATGAAMNHGDRPFLPPHVGQRYLPLSGSPAGARYFPFVLGVADVHYTSQSHGVDLGSRVSRLVEPIGGPVPVNWEEAEPATIPFESLAAQPAPGIPFEALPEISLDPKSVKQWEELFSRWLRTDGALKLWRSRELRLSSEPGESERDFRVRCAHRAREFRDEKREALRKRYEGKMEVVNRRLLRNEQAVGKQQQQAQHRSLDTVVTVGTTILGAFLGRRTPSASRVSSAMRKASTATKGAGDIQRARETLAQTQSELAELQAEFDRELASLELGLIEAERVELETVAIKPSSRDVALRFVGLVWVAHRQGQDGRWRAD